MSCITTFSGIRFSPADPQVDDIRIEDIAHALSMLCRANGHFKEFFSVGSHSLHCVGEAKARGYSKRMQLACLLHDASESYLSDVTRPVKAQLPEYIRMEQKLQNLIYLKFLKEPLTDVEREALHSVDDAMLYAEFQHFMGFAVLSSEPRILSSPDFRYQDFRTVGELFLQEFIQLSNV